MGKRSTKTTGLDQDMRYHRTDKPRVENTTMAEFAYTFPECWLCGSKHGLEIHHVARGPARKAGLNVAANLIRCCSRCHAEYLDGMPVVSQLALVKANNPAAYDRAAVNLLRGRQAGAITEEDIEQFTKGKP